MSAPQFNPDATLAAYNVFNFKFMNYIQSPDAPAAMLDSITVLLRTLPTNVVYEIQDIVSRVVADCREIQIPVSGDVPPPPAAKKAPVPAKKAPVPAKKAPAPAERAFVPNSVAALGHEFLGAFAQKPKEPAKPRPSAAVAEQANLLGGALKFHDTSRPIDDLLSRGPAPVVDNMAVRAKNMYDSTVRIATEFNISHGLSAPDDSISSKDYTDAAANVQNKVLKAALDMMVKIDSRLPATAGQQIVVPADNITGLKLLTAVDSALLALKAKLLRAVEVVSGSPAQGVTVVSNMRQLLLAFHNAQQALKK